MPGVWKSLLSGLGRRSPAPIPVFFITRDRVAVLREAIKSLEPFRDRLQVVIHDNDSTYPGMNEALHELEASGVYVYRAKHTGGIEDISDSVAETIERWFAETGSAARHYVVSDPDIALDDPPPDLIDLYVSLLRKYRDAAVVGPMLRIDDIPDTYPLRDRVIQGHTEQFWHKTPTTVCVLGKQVVVQQAPIDTTFGMYRRGFRFKRLNMGIRVYPPYAARHLDWYIDPAAMTPDQAYYMQSASDVAHWGAGWLRDAMADG